MPDQFFPGAAGPSGHTSVFPCVGQARHPFSPLALHSDFLSIVAVSLLFLRTPGPPTNSSPQQPSQVRVDDHLPDLLKLPHGSDLHDHPLVENGTLVLQVGQGSHSGDRYASGKVGIEYWYGAWYSSGIQCCLKVSSLPGLMGGGHAAILKNNMGSPKLHPLSSYDFSQTCKQLL